jgi:hypothetical protein
MYQTHQASLREGYLQQSRLRFIVIILDPSGPSGPSPRFCYCGCRHHDPAKVKKSRLKLQYIDS